MGAGKRRGRERQRATPPPGCATFARGRFWVSFDTRTGEAWSRHGDLIPVGERDTITRVVLAMLRKYGVEPADPLQIRDLMFGG